MEEELLMDSCTSSSRACIAHPHHLAGVDARPREKTRTTTPPAGATSHGWRHHTPRRAPPGSPILGLVLQPIPSSPETAPKLRPIARKNAPAATAPPPATATAGSQPWQAAAALARAEPMACMQPHHPLTACSFASPYALPPGWRWKLLATVDKKAAPCGILHPSPPPPLITARRCQRVSPLTYHRPFRSPAPLHASNARYCWISFRIFYY